MAHNRAHELWSAWGRSPGWFENLETFYGPNFAHLEWQTRMQQAQFGLGPWGATGNVPGGSGMTELGFPKSGMLPPSGPGGVIAAEAQLQAERAVQEYNQRLGAQASQVLRQGMANFQSYRPGGAASLMAGLYGQQAQTYLNRRTDYVPDLMFHARREAEFQARRRARRGAYLGFAGNMIGSIGQLAGGIGSMMQGFNPTQFNFGGDPTQAYGGW